jgi:hypothetical protein
VLRSYVCRETLALLSAGLGAALILAGGAPQALAAVDTVPTLTGELGTAQAAVEGDSNVDCTSTGNGTMTYDVSGTAAGPYSGTFTASGTIVINDNEIQSFVESFTIDSGLTHIVGTVRPTLPSNATCDILIGSPTVEHAVANFDGRYDATISGPTGTLSDHGTVGQTTSFTSGGANVPPTLGVVSAGFNSDRETSLVDVSPAESVNVVGTTHTVTVRVRDHFFGPIQAAKVLITVEGSVSQTGQCTTGLDGTCDFTYLGPAAPGADSITACYDFDNDGTVDPGERCGTATKAWTEPASTPGTATGGGSITTITETSVVFGFGGADSLAGGPRGSCDVIDRTANVRIHCLDVLLVLITGTHATIAGEATMNGIATNYHIDVDDGATAGVEDTFTIQTDSGYFATGPVTSGNVEVNSR